MVCCIGLVPSRVEIGGIEHRGCRIRARLGLYQFAWRPTTSPGELRQGAQALRKTSNRWGATGVARQHIPSGTDVSRDYLPIY